MCMCMADQGNTVAACSALLLILLLCTPASLAGLPPMAGGLQVLKDADMVLEVDGQRVSSYHDVERACAKAAAAAAADAAATGGAGGDEQVPQPATKRAKVEEEEAAEGAAAAAAPPPPGGTAASEAPFAQDAAAVVAAAPSAGAPPPPPEVALTLCREGKVLSVAVRCALQRCTAWDICLLPQRRTGCRKRHRLATAAPAINMQRSAGTLCPTFPDPQPALTCALPPCTSSPALLCAHTGWGTRTPWAPTAWCTGAARSCRPRTVACASAASCLRGRTRASTSAAGTMEAPPTATAATRCTSSRVRALCGWRAEAGGGGWGGEGRGARDSTPASGRLF